MVVFFVREAKRFSKIDRNWQRIMARAHENPVVVACCVADDFLLQLLTHLQVFLRRLWLVFFLRISLGQAGFHVL